LDSNKVRWNESTANGGGILCHYDRVSQYEPPQDPALQTLIITNNTVEGNTIHTGGNQGGGVYCGSYFDQYVDLTMMGNTINSNIVDRNGGSGGGVYVGGCNLIMEKNTVEGNQIISPIDSGGAPGVLIRNGTVGGIIGNDIFDNTCLGHGGGLALDFVRGEDVLIKGNKILGNTAQIGAGIDIVGASSGPEFRIINNLVAENKGVHTQEGAQGCGLNIGFASGLLVNNTIAHNDLREVDLEYRNSAKGGGIRLWGNCTWKLINSIVWGNLKGEGESSSTFRNEIHLEAGSGREITLTIEYSCMPGTSYITTGEGGTHTVYWDTNTNKTYPDNPRFAGAFYDPEEEAPQIDPRLKYTLMPYFTDAPDAMSPLIDSGDNSPDGVDIGQGEKDLMTRDRVVDGDWDGEGSQVPIVDMGAYEMQPNDNFKVWPLPGDVNWDCAVNILDLIVVRSKLNEDPNVGALNWRADVNVDGYINLLDLIEIRNHLNTRCR